MRCVTERDTLSSVKYLLNPGKHPDNEIVLMSNQNMFKLINSNFCLTLSILVTPKCIVWQTVKTQMKCRTIGSTLFAKDKNQSSEKYNLFRIYNL